VGCKFRKELYCNLPGDLLNHFNCSHRHDMNKCPMNPKNINKRYDTNKKDDKCGVHGHLIMNVGFCSIMVKLKNGKKKNTIKMS